MKELTSYTNDALHEKTLLAAADEKSATLKLLEHLAEVDRRRLYATRAYSSLWEYVHKALGYSEAQASDRVSAMRLMVKLPEVKKKLENGTLSLTTTAKLGAHVRREKCGREHTLTLLNDVAGKSSREVERVLVSHSSEPAKKDQIRAVTPDRTRVTIEVDQEFLELAQRVKELKGNPALAMQDVFRTAMKEFVKRREPTQPKSKQRAALRAPEVRVTPGTQVSNSSYIPAANRNFVKIRSGERCEFVDRATGRRCESRSGLEIDHIKPRALGGEHSRENLRHYCKTHNLLAAVETFGREKMEPYLKL